MYFNAQCNKPMFVDHINAYLISTSTFLDLLPFNGRQIYSTGLVKHCSLIHVMLLC